MPLMSRRMFLVSSVAIVLAACTNDSKDSATSTTSTPETTTTGTPAPAPTPAPTVASSTTVAPTTVAPTTVAPTIAAPTTITTTITVPSAPDLSADPFTLGVASGDPDATSVVLWTRLAPDPLHGGGMPDVDVEVLWELASNDAFTDIVTSGIATVRAEDAHSIHVIAAPPTSILAGADLFYRFRVGDYTSPTGQTRLAPTGAVSTATFVSASCQDYQDGFYTAHRDIVEQNPDFLVWLGDYIYESAGSPVGTNGSVRSHGTPEPKDLTAYRDRYALYKMDEHLQAAHHACPWFVIWDDHEVENNYAGTTPQDAADAPTFVERRQAAYRAWWEHQPVRLDPPPATGEYRIYRAVQWGDLIGMTLLDTRQYRTDQACGDVKLSLDPACPETFADDRTLTGPAQLQFIIDTVGKQGTQWNVIGQQIVMADATLNGAVLNYDQWDGYPKNREQILRYLADNAVPNAIVLSGDIHLASVAVLKSGGTMGGADGTPVAIEFVDTSISSAAIVPPETAAFVKSFPEIVDAEVVHRGYTLHKVSPQTWTAVHRIVESALVQDSTVGTYNTYVVDAGTPAVRIV